MNTFDWVLVGIACAGISGWIFWKWISSDKDSLR